MNISFLCVTGKIRIIIHCGSLFIATVGDQYARKLNDAEPQVIQMIISCY